MIYLIGGAPRTGKTTLAKMIAKRKDIPYISTDLIRDAIDEAYPELKIKAEKWEKWSERFYPMLLSLIKHSQEVYPDTVIEGDIFFPDQVNNIAQRYKLKCVYLGVSNIDLETLIGQNIHDDWISELEPSEQSKLPDWIMSISKRFKIESEKFSIPYFDVSKNRPESLEKAYSSLFE